MVWFGLSQRTHCTVLPAIHAYLNLFRDPPQSQDEALPRLARTLDALAAAIHELPEGDVSPDNDAVEEETKPLNAEYTRFREAAILRFPTLGLYPWSDPLGDIDEPRMMGDAIDDIADIAVDLRRALWRWEHVGESDAAWHLHFGYRSHWGAHLHNLRAYLHVVITRM
jgi:hypothetical protein